MGHSRTFEPQSHLQGYLISHWARIRRQQLPLSSPRTPRHGSLRAHVPFIYPSGNEPRPHDLFTAAAQSQRWLSARFLMCVFPTPPLRALDSFCYCHLTPRCPGRGLRWEMPPAPGRSVRTRHRHHLHLCPSPGFSATARPGKGCGYCSHGHGHTSKP